MDFEICNQLHKLFFFEKPTKYFPLMIRDSDDALPFCAKDFFILLNDVGGIFEFIHVLGSFVQLFCFNFIIISKQVNQQLFDFTFVESLCLFDVFRTLPPLPPLKTTASLSTKQSFSTMLFRSTLKAFVKPDPNKKYFSTLTFCFQKCKKNYLIDRHVLLLTFLLQTVIDKFYSFRRLSLHFF